MVCIRCMKTKKTKNKKQTETTWNHKIYEKIYKPKWQYHCNIVAS